MKDSSISEWIRQARNADWDDKTLADKTIELAGMILSQANAGMRHSEIKQAKQLSRMMGDASGKALSLVLADRIFRPTSPIRRSEQFRYLINEYGIPKYLGVFDQFLMGAGIWASEYMPSFVMNAVIRNLRKQSNKVILPAENKKLHSHLSRRRKDGIGMNLNQLGEAVLGEAEARHRLRQVDDRLASPDCNYISVKLSSIFSQINLVAFDESVALIQERLRTLYRTAMERAVTQADGSKKAKFVNLDMEEYRDLNLTCEAFKRTLMEDEFMSLEAGIVLQAYLPDAWEVQMGLCKWAKERVKKGGARIKIRLVKGANLAMEKVDASLHGWAQAPYETKEMVDANYKRMLQYGCDPKPSKYVRFGVASHNIFDLSYALLLRELKGSRDDVEVEMLEGMANHQARVINDAASGLLLYAPVVLKKDFPNAIAYLVRRLDENTSEENFLHDLFGMTQGSPTWEKQKNKFLKACQECQKTKFGPNRTQNRSIDQYPLTKFGDTFVNEGDTDWSLAHNVTWIREKIAQEADKGSFEIPLVIGGKEQVTHLWGIGRDSSKSGEESYKFAYADYAMVELMLTTAQKARQEWSQRSIKERGALLHKVAQELSTARGDLIACMVRDSGKAPGEGDVEVSEAIDFCRYYAEGLSRPGFDDGLQMTPLGTICVMSPWNFPCAIPVGGVAAALMAGNTVIFKPSPQGVYVGWLLAQIFWRAGIPQDVLQFSPIPENQISRKLIEDERISGIILTGAYSTGQMFRSWRPELSIFAETSGKDAMIITETADIDQAVKDLVKSAFGHAGQKCSAASIAIVEAGVYDNPAFLRQLKDAVSSLKVGSSWQANSIVTPLIHEPGEKLERALTMLEPGEEWLLAPDKIDHNPCLWSPGVRIGVKPGSWFHKTECFGPVLGVIRASNLEEAIDIQNDSDYGLTGGIESLDEREIALWKDKVQVGNAYVNRSITGAIVRRQPFGGWRKSSMGFGSKAGGPNYLTMLTTWTEVKLPEQMCTPHERIASFVETLCGILPENAKRLRQAAGSLSKWWNEEFSIDHDPSQVYGESNIFRYIPEPTLLYRVSDDDTDGDMAIVLLATKLAGVNLVVSMDDRAWINTMAVDHDVTFVVESLTDLQGRLPFLSEGIHRLRYHACDLKTRSLANESGMTILDRPILANGRLELLNYLREQTLTQSLHRYGNMIPSANQVKNKHS
ncbi:MAG: bifunctional proline dehydrogenase/L-glutamate gamma-semialdehyde dehydrogenase [Akkermansia sp.]